MARNLHERPDSAVLAAFGLAEAPVTPAASGLINRTWHVVSTHGEPRVLQRVNAIFPAAVNEDIDALTRHLAAQGLLTPRIVPTRGGRLWLEHGGATWRVLTAIDGVTRDALDSPAQAREAGRALAGFHRAVRSFEHPLKNVRLGVHDTQAHLAALRAALTEHASHRDIDAVTPLADEVLARAARLPPLPAVPDRIVHGDPKVSNIMFDRTSGRALCLIDLDTLARMPITLELGDAMRSWCNPDPEDAAGAKFSLPLFEAALAGYAEAAEGFLLEQEWSAIPAATLTITIELAARFCKDAVAERYFSWNAERFASASEHNRARTAGQLSLGASVERQLDEMRRVVVDMFGAHVQPPL